MLVRDLLDDVFITVNATDNLSKAWAVMKEAHLTGACVVTEDNQLVGFVTDGNFIRACMPSEADIAIYDEIMENMELPDGFLVMVRSAKVENIMQPQEQVITINSDEPILKALALMFQHRLRRIPVLEGNHLIGTISRGAILTELLVNRDISET